MTKRKKETEATDPSTPKLADIEARLETYRQTLTEIYDLYDKKIEELSLIRRLGDSIRVPVDLPALCRRIFEAVAHEIAVDHLVLVLVDPETRDLSVLAIYDAGREELAFHPDSVPWSKEFAPASIDEARGPVARALESGQAIRLELTDSLIFLPLLASHQAVGLLVLSRPAAQPFTDDDVRLLTIIADQAATALANVRLYDELAAANARLQESERQARQTSLYLERLLDVANDVIFTLDESGRITYVNRKSSEWGYVKEDLLGRTFDQILADATLDPIPDQAVAAILAAESGLGLELGLRTKAGERRDVLVSTSRIPEEGQLDPAHSAFLVLARDITGRKQLEQQLFHSEKLASIGILAAGVAHEIGNPLSAISGYSQILLGGAEPAETREYLEAIEDQTRRIGRIISDLLDYSRPSTGLRSEINLVEAIPQVMSMLTAQRAFRNLTIEQDLDPLLPPVLMDRDHLAQLLVNIAVNAAQAMPGGGTLHLAATRRADRIEIAISDTGPGIPPEIQARVFDPFFTTKPAGQGTGLGLAICHRIVETYKGSISLVSQIGQGTTFIVRLPAVSQG